MKGLQLHDRYETVLVEHKPDPDRPHSSTAPAIKTAAMMRGWYSLRDGNGKLRAVVTTSGTGIRILGMQIPDTLVRALVGRTVGEVVDHPAIDPTAIIRHAERSMPKDTSSTDVFLSEPWFSVQAKGTVLREGCPPPIRGRRRAKRKADPGS